MADVDVVSVRVRPNLRTFRAELRSEMRAIDADFEINVKAEIDQASLRAARAEIARVGSNAPAADIRVNAESAQFRAQMEEITRPRTVEVDVDTKKLDRAKQAFKEIQQGLDHVKTSASSLIGVTGSVIGGVTSLAAAFAKLTVGIAVVGALGSSLVSLTSVLLASTQAAGLLPGILASAALAMGTVKLGADGIKKAFAGLEPTITKLKAGISAVFEKGLSPAIANAKAVIPQLSDGFKGLAASLSGVAVKFTEAFKSQGGVATTNALLKETSGIIGNLAGAFGPVAIGMLNIAKIGLEMFKPFTEGIAAATQRFADFTRSAQGVQQIRDFIQRGIDAFRTLRDVADNVGETIIGVFRAAKKASGDALGGITQITGAMRDFVNSTQGQATLVSLFTSLRGVISAVLPIVKTLADIIGNTLAPVIADIATAIGPALNRVFQGIGEALKAASPGIVALATGFADLIDGLRPALPMIGEVANQLGSVLGEALRNLAPPFLSLIQDLAPHLPAVATAVGQLAVAGLRLLDALTPLIGPVAAIASEMAKNLLPVIAALAPIIPPLAQALGGALLQAMQTLAPVIPPLVAAFGQIVTALVQGLMPALPAVINLIPALAQAFILLAPVILALAIPFIATTGAAVALGQALAGDFKGALETTKQTIKTTGEVAKTLVDTDWAAMAASVTARAGEIKAGVSDMGGSIINSMQEGIGGATGVLQNGAGGWAGFIASATSNAGAALETGVSPWDDFIASAMDTANTTVSSGMSDIVGTASKGIANTGTELDRIESAVGGAFAGTQSQLNGVGSSMMQGLTAGINAAGRSAIAAASAIAASVVGIMSSVLRINSPSKVIRDKIGVAIPQGLAAGIEKDSGVALGAAAKMANDVVGASAAAVDGVSPNFASTLTVQAQGSSTVEIAANAAFDRVTEALEGWSVVLDPRGVATLSRAGAALNGKR